MRGVTSFLDTMSTTFGFLLTRLMRGVTLTPLSEPAFGKISTHTPHARRDSIFPSDIVANKKISTHTPHARRDLALFVFQICHISFLLTRLMRGVT